MIPICVHLRNLRRILGANQKAHEVSRELTAWAGSWSLTRLATPGIGPILWQVASGLGPPRPAQHRGSLAKAAIQTVDDALASSLAQQGGLAVSRLDGRGFSLRAQSSVAFLPEKLRSFPRPIPRIRGVFAVHYCRLDAAGPHAATQGELSSRMAAKHHWRRP